MDDQSFDRLARALAIAASRRSILKSLAGGVGGGLVSVLGMDRGGLAQQNPGPPQITNRPRADASDMQVIVTWTTDRPADSVVEYGLTADYGQVMSSPEMTTDHWIALVDLVPDETYNYRVTSSNEHGTAMSRRARFRAPSCPPGTESCAGTCVGACPEGQALDPVSCVCGCAAGATLCGGACVNTGSDPMNCGACGAVCGGDNATVVCAAGVCVVESCAAGFADCDGNPANGCETALGTNDNCLACGERCDDGNACTENTCDPSAGCVTTNASDGTACGTAGTCQAGACVECVAGGTCSADTDCCDEEVCCDGACVDRSSFDDDPSNCGACGAACPDEPCQTTTCSAGVCTAAPIPDGEACGEDNSCIEDGQCADGVCEGTHVADGTPCGDDQWCTEGICGGPAEDAKVVALILINADTDRDIGPLSDGATLDLAALPTRNLNVRAQTSPATVGSVRFGYDANSNYATENGAPYTLAGDANGNYNPWTPTPGAHTITATCYAEPDAGGAAGTPLVVRFTVAGDLPFNDDFETGDLSRWTTTSNITVQTAHVAAGRYAARGTSTGAGIYARYRMTAERNEVYARVRFKLLSQGANPVFVLRTGTRNAASLFGVQITTTGKLAVHNSIVGQSTASATAVTKNQWHEVQVRVRIAGTSSETEVWYNNVRVAELSGTTSLGTTGVGMVQIGDHLTNRTFDIAFDDVAASTTRIPAAGTTPEPPPSSGGTSTVPGANQSVLMATYTFKGAGGVDWSKVRYLPRQFVNGVTFSDPTRGTLRVDSAGSYVGWDIFPTYNSSVHRVETRADWLQMEVNRGVTLAVVWRGGTTAPNWLSSWTKSGDVTISGKVFPTYRKSFAAGKIVLGAVYDPGAGSSATRDTYLVLLAEADAKPSPAPVVPAGQAAPQPNQTCPAWVHSQYAALAPDGRSYPTWHHQIDAVYWCYHRHEHGSNPASFSPTHKPFFGYAAAAHGMEEPHAGFKNFVFDDPSGNRWMITHHFGTAGLARVCNRFHTVGFAVRKIATGELLADLHFMGDFGRAVVNSTQQAITPSACPNQAAQATAAGSQGIRQIASQADGAVNYEPWRVDTRGNILGVQGTFTVNNPDAMVICNNSTCNQAVQTGQSGSMRFFTPNDGFAIVAGPNTGTFYTDPDGKKLMSAGQAGALRQYVKPGISLSLPPGGGNAGHCYDVNAWGKMFVCGATSAQSTNREGSIQAPN